MGGPGSGNTGWGRREDGTGRSGNPGGRPKSAAYANAARDLLSSPVARGIVLSHGDGSVLPDGWLRDALTGAQVIALRDFIAAARSGEEPKATDRLLDRAEGRPVMGDEDREALGKLGYGEGFALFEAALRGALGEKS